MHPNQKLQPIRYIMKKQLSTMETATMKPTNGTKLLSLAAAVLLTDTCMASTVLVGSLTPFTGAGAGQGIVLAPTTVYALNLGGSGTLSIQGQTFTGADLTASLPAGVSVTGAAQFNYGLTTDYGTNPSDGQNLDTMLSTAWYAFGAASSGAAMTIDLAVTAGQQYKLQLLLHEPWATGQGNSTVRDFNILVENSAGTLVTGVTNFNPGAETNGSNQVGADFGLVYTYSFTASDTSYSVRLAQNETGKQNPNLGALVLTQIPEPSTALLGGLGLLALLRRRR
jgi:hypothetical protein